MKVIEWKCSESERLDSFLRRELPSASGENVTLSNSKIRRFIVAGSVYVNQKQCRLPAFDLKRGDVVKACIDLQKLVYEKQPDDIKFNLTPKDVLFEDDDIIVVNKPAFFPTEKTIAGDRDNLQQAVIRYLWEKNPSLRNPPYVGIMHRLDRETSGVILFTKTRKVNAAVHAMFENHTARKMYRAVCTKKTSAKIPPEKFSCSKSIVRISPSSKACKMGVTEKKSSSDKNVQEAYTDFSLAGEKNGLYYINAFPKTGRTHQIRVHLSSMGFPLLGDELYGGKNSGRIMLHACKLEFPHPVTDETMTVSAPMPEGFSV